MSTAAYFMFDVTITNPEGIKPYQEQVEKTLQPFGGICLVLAGAIEVMEGKGPEGFTVMVQFPDLAMARAWYHSPDYQQIIGYRQSSATTHAYLVQGIS